MSKDNENIEIDINEYKKQQMESMLNSKSYAMVEIIVQHNETEAYCNLQTKNATMEVVGKLYLTIKAIAKTLKKKCPLECKLAEKMFNTIEGGIYDVTEEDDESEE